MEFCINKQSNFCEYDSQYFNCAEPCMMQSCGNSNILVAPRNSCTAVCRRDPRIPPQAEMFSCFCPPPCEKSCCSKSKCSKRRKSKSIGCLCLSKYTRESFSPLYTCKIPTSMPCFETVYSQSYRKIL